MTKLSISREFSDDHILRVRTATTPPLLMTGVQAPGSKGWDGYLVIRDDVYR